MSINKKTFMSPEQRRYLENFFNENRYPNRFDIKSISRVTNLPHKSVYTWFSNKRCAARKMKKEEMKYIIANKLKCMGMLLNPCVKSYHVNGGYSHQCELRKHLKNGADPFLL